MNEIDDEYDAEDEAQLAQQDLLEGCLDIVFDTRDEALDDGVTDPVVLLIDCEDVIGNQIANAWLGEEVVRDAIAEEHLNNPDSDLTTVFAQAFAFEDCRDEIPTVFPYLAPMFEEPPPIDGFFTIAITAGGASAFLVPDSARS